MKLSDLLTGVDYTLLSGSGETEITEAAQMTLKNTGKIKSDLVLNLG